MIDLEGAIAARVDSALRVAIDKAIMAARDDQADGYHAGTPLPSNDELIAPIMKKFRADLKALLGENAMSWSFYAQGKPATVGEKAIAEIGAKRCEGAEEVARIKVMEAVNELCHAGCNSECAVKVEASGSAYTENGVQKSNVLKLSFETVSAS